MNKYYFWCILLLLGVALTLSAQDRSLQDAEIYYNNGNYTQALNSMDRVDADEQESRDYYLLMAKIQLATGDYASAQFNLERYRRAGGDSDLLNEQIMETIKNAKDIPANKVFQPLPAGINTIHSEYSPVISPEGNFLLFGSDRRSPFLGENIFWSELVGGRWTEPLELNELCTDRNETPGSFDKEGNLYLSGQYGNTRKNMNSSIYFAEKDGSKWKTPTRIAAVSTNWNDINPSVEGNYMVFASNRGGDNKSYDIYIAENSSSGWQTPELLSVNTAGNEIAPFIAPGGNLLFFASDGYPGFGGYDIYMAKRRGTGIGWGMPENLGPTINTHMDERDFNIQANSLSAFYSTSRFDSLNMENIYSLNLEALGFKIVYGYVHDELNTRVETNILWIYDGFEFYISSDDKGEFLFLLPPLSKDGEAVITYQVFDERYFEVEENVDVPLARNEIIIPLQRKNVLRLIGRVYDQFDNNVMTTINWDYVHEGENVRRESQTNEEGRYLIEVPKLRSINYAINESGYAPLSGTWQLVEGEATQERDFVLSAYASGQEYGFIIEFDFDSANIRQNSQPEVTKMYNMLNENPNMRVEIGGHTDSRGASEYNTALSRRRAEAVRNAVVNRGIDGRRISIGAYGEDRPIADNETEEGRQRNRRVEMTILGVD